MGRLAVYKRIDERDLFVCLKLYEGNVVIDHAAWRPRTCQEMSNSLLSRLNLCK